MKQMPDTSTVVHSFCVWHSFDLGGTKAVSYTHPDAADEL